jgi:DNA-binding MarR family transcriptional regulator
MSMTTQFFDALGQRAGTPDRPFVDANEIAQELGMNDTDLIAAIQALEEGNLIEDVERGEMIDVRLTEQGVEIWKQQHHR